MTTTAIIVQAGKPRDRTALKVFALRVAVILVVALIWEATSRFEILNSTEFPPVSLVAWRLVSTLLELSTWAALGNTVLGWIIGMAISIVFGVILGMLVGRSRFLSRSTTLMTDFLRATPGSALLFVLILMLGTTLSMKVALIVFAAFFPIFIQSQYGVRSVDSVLGDLQATYRIHPLTGFLRIRLPAAMPFIVTGVRVSASLALIVGVIAEYLGGAAGVGDLVEQVRQIGDYPRMYALILLVGFVSVALNGALLFAEKKLLSWHPSHRKAA
ncbi:MAG: ABC transporter permease [Pseudoclavibacter sp.]